MTTPGPHVEITATMQSVPDPDTLSRPAIDREQEHAFRATRPTKELACIHPGCPKKFRPSTEYKDVLVHMRSAHGLKG